MPSLPADRVTPFKSPISYVGVDCFGPLEVRIKRKKYFEEVRCTFHLYGGASNRHRNHSFSGYIFLPERVNLLEEEGKPKQIRSDL